MTGKRGAPIMPAPQFTLHRTMTLLIPAAENIWSASAPQLFLGLHVGTRMTVLRLGSGGLLVHSPIALDDSLRNEVDALGEVRHIVCPNPYHHLYAGEWKTAYPAALLHGPAALHKKRKDLQFDAELTEQPHPDWVGELELVSIRGCLLGETVLYHRPSRSLIASDLVENFQSSDHWLTDLYLRAQGIRGTVGWGRLFRFMYRDRIAARACVDRILAWPFERVILAHGDVLENDAHAAVTRGMAWLG